MSKRICLLIPNGEAFNREWTTDHIICYEPSPSHLQRCFMETMAQSNAEAVLFWDPELGMPNVDLVHALLDSPDDLWHAGLKLGMSGKPGLLDFVNPTYMFNRDVEANQVGTSWRVSLRACLVRREVLQQVGFLDPGFQTIEAAALEWGHRCIRSGVLCQHRPDLLIDDRDIPPVVLSPAEEMRFIGCGFGKRWMTWALSRAILAGNLNIPQTIQAVRVFKNFKSLPEPAPFVHRIIDLKLREPVPDITVLIPTLERYPYLRVLLDQLRKQSISPREIIVIDQTPVSQRQVDFYREFQELPLQVIYQDQPGQCSSRNAGLQAASGRFVLFIDDDDEVPTDLIEKHLRNIQRYQAQASCGVAHEIGAGPLPKAFTYLRASDVFPTNNSLVQRAALDQSGWFDLAYNRGARADADLGMRLYLSGARLILDPDIAVLHHHAPRGGLRVHHARKITYASSRQRLLHRQIPSPTELYLAKRYFSPSQVIEMKWISVFATLSFHSSFPRRVLKFILGLLFMPDTLSRLHHNERAADRLLNIHPTIPRSSSGKD